jgi:lactoylglutathione lyase
MEFSFKHCNINVTDIERSLAFYKEALGLHEENRFSADDGGFTILFLSDGRTGFALELTCMHEHTQPYELGENESHIAFCVEDIEAARAKHREMGVVCFENEAMGIYFIEDPDGYWLEIIPKS